MRLPAELRQHLAKVGTVETSQESTARLRKEVPRPRFQERCDDFADSVSTAESGETTLRQPSHPISHASQPEVASGVFGHCYEL
jgi:hypothetical protein